MSRLISFAESKGLQVTDITVDTMNPVIFSSSFITSVYGLTKDGGKYYTLDTANNSATEITADLVTKRAKKAFNKLDDAKGYASIAEDYSLVSSVTLSTNPDADPANDSNLPSVLKGLGMKVTDVTVETQNDIIFKTTGIKNINGLTKDNGKYFQLDTKRNTAKLVDADSVAAQAAKDILKGKVTDFTKMADVFNLISSITLVRKDD